MKKTSVNDAIIVAITVIVILGLILISIFYEADGRILLKNNSTRTVEQKDDSEDEVTEDVSEADSTEEGSSPDEAEEAGENDGEASEELEEFIDDFIRKWVEDPFNTIEIEGIFTSDVKETLNQLLETEDEETDREVKIIDVFDVDGAKVADGFIKGVLTVYSTYEEGTKQNELFYLTIEQKGDSWIITDFSETLKQERP